VTGTFSVNVHNVSAARSYVTTYIVNSANTFEYKTVTIPGDTTGTWPTDNSTGLILFFPLGTGTTYGGATANTWNSSLKLAATGSTNLLATAGATFYITGVQLEKGSTATSFDYRPYGTELALCQRYYENKAFGMTVNGTTQLSGSMHYAVHKRAVPTITRLSNYNSSGEAGTAVSINNSVAESHWYNSGNAIGGVFTISAEL
jgi:hypothetical protein